MPSLRITPCGPASTFPRKQVIDLNGFFGLHPSLASFKPLWDQGHLAIVHAAGSPDTTRSHFDAQDYMESGTPGVKSHHRWLAQSHVAKRSRSRRHSVPRASRSALRCRAFLPAKLRQSPSAMSTASGIAGGNPAAAPLGNTFEAMYAQSVDSVLHGTGQRDLRSGEDAEVCRSATLHARRRAQTIPSGRFGDALRQTAQLIKANLGVQIAFTDIGGWDHHVNEGAAEGQLANVLRDFSQSIAAFWTDLGPLGEDTVLVTMSEFGRTARENGNRGTDHGHANVMFVLGGPVRGGRVYGRWPGLDPSQLNEGRDLALTTDFRRVLGEAVSRHLGNAQLWQPYFPGFDNSPHAFLRYLG